MHDHSDNQYIVEIRFLKVLVRVRGKSSRREQKYASMYKASRM